MIAAAVSPIAHVNAVDRGLAGAKDLLAATLLAEAVELNAGPAALAVEAIELDAETPAESVGASWVGLVTAVGLDLLGTERLDTAVEGGLDALGMVVDAGVTDEMWVLVLAAAVDVTVFASSLEAES